MRPYQFLLLLALGTPASLINAASPAQTVLGKIRPDFTLVDMNGKTTTPADWKNKVVVLNFWASWCTPCQKEVPIFNRIQKEYGIEGVQFIGLAVDSKQNVLTFLKKIPIDYPILIGDQSALAIIKQYGNQDGVLPYTVFIDRNGKIAAVVKGGLTETYTRNTIEKLL